MPNNVNMQSKIIWMPMYTDPRPHCIVLVKYKQSDKVYESAAVKEKDKWIPDRVNMIAWRYFNEFDFSRR